MKMLRRKSGQGTIEWVLLAAIVVGIIAVLYKNIKQPASDKINQITTGITNSGN